MCIVTPTGPAHAWRFWLPALALEYRTAGDKNPRDNRLSASCLYVKKRLPAAGLVWRRAAPTLRIRDPHKEEKMATIHEALQKCSVDRPGFYEDEVDIHLNPKIGADWQVRSQQKRVVTPGQNENIIWRGPCTFDTQPNSIYLFSLKLIIIILECVSHTSFMTTIKYYFQNNQNHDKSCLIILLIVRNYKYL